MGLDTEKLQHLLSRHTGRMKEVMDDIDVGDLARATRVLEHGNDLVDDIMLLVTDMIARRRDDQERERDRYEDSRDRGRDRDDRGRESSWDRGRGRGSSRDDRDYRRR